MISALIKMILSPYLFLSLFALAHHPVMMPSMMRETINVHPSIQVLNLSNETVIAALPSPTLDFADTEETESSSSLSMDFILDIQSTIGFTVSKVKKSVSVAAKDFYNCMTAKLNILNDKIRAFINELIHDATVLFKSFRVITADMSANLELFHQKARELVFSAPEPELPTSCLESMAKYALDQISLNYPRAYETIMSFSKDFVVAPATPPSSFGSLVKPVATSYNKLKAIVFNFFAPPSPPPSTLGSVARNVIKTLGCEQTYEKLEHYIKTKQLFAVIAPPPPPTTTTSLKSSTTELLDAILFQMEITYYKVESFAKALLTLNLALFTSFLAIGAVLVFSIEPTTIIQVPDRTTIALALLQAIFNSIGFLLDAFFCLAWPVHALQLDDFMKANLRECAMWIIATYGARKALPATPTWPTMDSKFIPSFGLLPQTWVSCMESDGTPPLLLLLAVSSLRAPTNKQRMLARLEQLLRASLQVLLLSILLFGMYLWIILVRIELIDWLVGGLQSTTPTSWFSFYFFKRVGDVRALNCPYLLPLGSIFLSLSILVSSQDDL